MARRRKPRELRAGLPHGNGDKETAARRERARGRRNKQYVGRIRRAAVLQPAQETIMAIKESAGLNDILMSAVKSTRVC